MPVGKRLDRGQETRLWTGTSLTLVLVGQVGLLSCTLWFAFAYIVV